MEKQYNDLKKLYLTEFKTIRNSYKQIDPNITVDWDESFFEITPLGRMFIDACTDNGIPRIVGIAKNGVMKKSGK